MIDSTEKNAGSISAIHHCYQPIDSNNIPGCITKHSFSIEFPIRILFYPATAFLTSPASESGNVMCPASAN